MSFHINPEGEVGKCSAQVRCPYGDFETGHYTTEEEAFRAYEAAMKGETFTRGLVKKDQKRLDPEDFKKFREKKHEKLERLIEKDVIDPVTQDVQKGMFLDLEEFNRAYREIKQSKEKRSEDLKNTAHLRRALALSPVGTSRSVPITEVAEPELWGGKLTKIRRDKKRNLLIATIESNGTQNKVEVPMDPNGEPLPEGQAWSNEVNVEELAVRTAQVSEYNAASANELILSDMKRSVKALRWATSRDGFTLHGAGARGEDQVVHWDPKTSMVEVTRAYRSHLENAKKAGVPNPQQFSMERLKDTLGSKTDRAGIDNRPYDGRSVAGRLLIEILQQNDGYKPNAYDETILRASFDEGERPFLDYSFSDLGLKKEV